MGKARFGFSDLMPAGIAAQLQDNFGNPVKTGCDHGMIELFTGDWLDELINAIADLKPKARA